MATPNEDFTLGITDADAYFGPESHVSHKAWNAFSPEERKAAIAQAKREVRQWLGRDLEDPSSVTAQIQDGYAVWEQALFILQNTDRTGRSGEKVTFNRVTRRRTDRSSINDVGLCARAMRWLGINRLKMERG